MLPARTVSVSIDRPPATVYAFVADAFNLPRWAPGFCSAISADANVEHGWKITTPDGAAHARFAPPNTAGIVDHWVTLAGRDTEVYVPLRVVANEAGSEVLLTVFRQASMSDGQHEADVEAVRGDLARLKELLESRPA
jgi:hypothetical protein